MPSVDYLSHAAHYLSCRIPFNSFQSLVYASPPLHVPLSSPDTWHDTFDRRVSEAPGRPATSEMSTGERRRTYREVSALGAEVVIKVLVLLEDETQVFIAH